MLSLKQVTLFVAPWLLLATTYPVYQFLERRYGKKAGYLGGFLFYWTLWCLLFPLALLGPQGLLGLFHGVSSPFGHPWWPSLLSSHKRCGGQAPGWCWSRRCWLWSTARWKRCCGEVPTSRFSRVRSGWRCSTPASALLVFHLAPMSVVPPTGGGRWGKAALVAQVCLLGLLWAWVANNTGSILWTAVAHILIDFSAASMGYPFHRNLFERQSADYLRHITHGLQ